MSILAWLKQTLAGKQPAQLSFAPGEENLSGLNLKEVIDAHLKWRDRLTALVSDPQAERPDPKQVCMDNLCILGKWLYSTGKKEFGHMQEYEQLRQTHAQFHTSAAAVVRAVTEGQTSQANSLLRGPFRGLSNDIQLRLVSLYSAVNKAA